MASRNPRGRTFTVMVVPHSESAPLTFGLSLRIIQVFCTLLVFGVMGTLIFLGRFHVTVAQAQEVDELRTINVQQKEQISDLVAQMEVLQAKAAELDGLDKQLRQMLNMDLGYGETSGAVIAAASGVDAEALGVGGGQASDVEAFVTPGGLAPENDFASLDPSLRDGSGLEESVAAVREQLDLRKQSLESVTLALQDQLAFLMARPTGWPTNGIITSGFGYRKSPYSWAREFHDGIDIGAPIGTPIYATADGTVTFVGWKAGYGLLLVIRHGFGFETRYGHTSRIIVSPGDKVARGELVAYVGNTGRSTGPHVHYEVHRYGRLLNPRDYLDPPTE